MIIVQAGRTIASGKPLQCKRQIMRHYNNPLYQTRDHKLTGSKVWRAVLRFWATGTPGIIASHLQLSIYTNPGTRKCRIVHHRQG